MCVLFVTQLMRLVGKLDPVNRFNQTSCMAEVSTTDRALSILNHCLIEIFVDIFYLSLEFFLFSGGIRSFPFFFWNITVKIEKVKLNSTYSILCGNQKFDKSENGL